MIQFDDGGMDGLGCAACGPPSLTDQFQMEGLGATSPQPTVGRVGDWLGIEAFTAEDWKQLASGLGLPATTDRLEVYAGMLTALIVMRMPGSAAPASLAPIIAKVKAAAAEMTVETLYKALVDAVGRIPDEKKRAGALMGLAFMEGALKEAGLIGVTAPPATPSPPAPVPAAGTLPAPSTTTAAPKIAVAASSSWEWVKAHKTSVGVGVAAAALAYLVLRPSGRGLSGLGGGWSAGDQVMWEGVKARIVRTHGNPVRWVDLQWREGSTSMNVPVAQLRPIAGLGHLRRMRRRGRR